MTEDFRTDIYQWVPLLDWIKTNVQVWVFLWINQWEYEMLLRNFKQKIEASKGSGIYIDHLRKTLVEHKIQFPETTLRVSKAQLYLNILRRNWVIGYKEWVKTFHDESWKAYQLIKWRALRSYMLREAVVERLKKVLEKRWYKDWIEVFLKIEQTIILQNPLRSKGKIYKIPPKSLRHLLRYANNEDSPSLSIENFIRTFWYSEEVAEILKTPLRKKRIASKEEILENKSFKRFIIKKLAEIQKKWEITQFSKAMSYAISCWNEEFSTAESLYVPQNLFTINKWMNLCKLIWIQTNRIDDLLAWLWLPKNTWKKQSGKRREKPDSSQRMSKRLWKRISKIWGSNEPRTTPSSLTSAVASTHPWSPDRCPWYRNPLDPSNDWSSLFLGQGRILAVTAMPCMLPLRVRVPCDEWGDRGSHDRGKISLVGGLWDRES